MSSLEQLGSDLDAYITGDIEFDPDSEPIDLGDIDAADRALRRVSRLEHDMTRLELLAAGRKRQIDEWLAETLAPMEREREWFERSVESWARAHLAGQKSQTVKLPSGVVKLTKARTRIDGPDPDESAPTHLVRVTRKWDKAAAAKATVPGPEPIDQTSDYWVHAAIDAQTGEVVPGLTHLIPKAETTCKVTVR